MNKFHFNIFLIILIFAKFSFASEPDTTYKTLKDTTFFKNKLNSYIKELTTIESEFVQQKFMSILTEAVESKGYFCYKNGTMIRWEYMEPFQYLIIINNGRMFIKDENKSSSFDLTASQSFIKLNSIIGKILQGNVLSDKNDFSCSFYENDLYYKLVLAPKSKDIKVFFNEIVLFFEKKMFSVARVILNEVSGDKTDILFNNRKINSEIPDEKFIIK